MNKISKKDWIEIVLHITFWAGVFYTLLSFSQPHIKMRIDHNGAILEESISHTLSPHIFLTFGFMMVLFYGNIFLVFKKVFRYKNILVKVLLPVAWFAIIFLADTYLHTLLPAQKSSDPMIQLESPPVNKKAFSTNADNDKGLGQPFPDNIIKKEVTRRQSGTFTFAEDGFSSILLFIFIIVFGLSVAYFFLKEWSRVEKMRSELAAVQLDTEVKFLKSQVNPHFLFNTLNNLFSMAQEKGNDDLADGISTLSGMMRYMIYESNEEKVPLKKEIDYIENCILLNKLRYADDEAKVQFNYPKQTENILIAPMLFIPFVENAFKHGVAIGQTSEISLSIAVEKSQLIFNCKNTIYQVKKMDDDKSGIGLENVKRRLKLAYPDKHELAIRDDGSKFAVELKIDL